MILYWMSKSYSHNLFFHFKESYFIFFIIFAFTSASIFFSVHWLNNFIIFLTLKEFSFTIANANANVYVNLFLFHLRSEVLIIEGYYTKYPNPTISFYYYITISNLSLSCLTFKEFSFAFAMLTYSYFTSDKDKILRC